MTKKQATALEKTLTAHSDIGGGKAVSVVPLVDAKIRGGMIVELDDKVIDTSILTKLTQLKMSLVA
jgi:F0F1-type ATP synthase delta subunit